MTATNLIIRFAGPPKTRWPRFNDVARRWLRRPRSLIILAILLVGGGLAAGWSWLVALGVAPFILSVAPCMAMCAVGACVMARGNSSCASHGSPTPKVSTSPDADRASGIEER